MALRSEKTSCGLAVRILLLCMVVLPLAAQHTFAVRHQRSLWWDNPGSLTVGDDGLRFMAAKKQGEGKVFVLAWEEIQQWTLKPTQVEIITYQDRLWQLGRDRHFRFLLVRDPGEESDFRILEARLLAALGRRLVRALPGEATASIWSVPAKRTGLPRGVEGALSFDGEQLRFDSDKPGHSRRWLLEDIETIASTGAHAFTVVAPERAIADQGGYRSFDFQLKQPMTPEQYRQLWLAIEAAHGTRLRFQTTNHSKEETR